MKFRSALPATALLVALALVGCGKEEVPRTATASSNPSDTSVLGGYGPGHDRPAAAPLTDAQGQAIPAPTVPPGAQAQAVRSADDGAVAVWVQDGHVVASTWTPAAGWTSAQPLEEIYGVASDPQIVSNGNGTAMAVWRHTVGSIQALRFSHFEQRTGWATPDVMPGALPRPDVSGPGGGGDGPRLQMDAQGNVVAQWPSGFDAREVQVARYVAGQGWSRAASEATASARSASPAAPVPSSVQ
jgi:hypothetical protein